MTDAGGSVERNRRHRTGSGMIAAYAWGGSRVASCISFADFVASDA